MLEPKAGMFLGRMTARIRDELWKKAVAGSRDGGCFQAWSARNEQGFEFRTHGDLSRQMIEIEGLWLVSLTKPPH